jgi:hypothetical protein
MKIRSGFVSNSSSSSFVIVARKSDVDAILTEMNDYDRAVVNHVSVGDKQAFGETLAIFQGSTGNDNSWEWFEYNGELPEGADRWESWDSFMDKLKEKAGANLLVSRSSS